MPRSHALPPPDLHGVARTLFLPLIARAQAPLWCPMLDPQDIRAAQTLALAGEAAKDCPIDGISAINILWRTQTIKQLGKDFFTRYPHAQGVNLGAGLSDEFQWLDNGQNRWMDVDLPEVVALRRRWMPSLNPRIELRAEDLRTPGWWSRLGLQRHNHHNPLLLVCEGVLMYMHPNEVKAFLKEIGEHAPDGSELLCDFISPLGIGQTTRANHHPGDSTAFHWGAHNGLEISAQHPRLELLEQHSVTEAYGWAAPWLETLCAPLLGGPLYGLAHIKLSDD